MMSLMLSTTLLIMGTVIPGTVQPKCPYIRSQMSCNQGLIDSACTVFAQDQATPWTKVAISSQKEEHACRHCA